MQLSQSVSPAPELASPTSAQTNTSLESGSTFDASNSVFDFDLFDIPPSAKRARVEPTRVASPFAANAAKLVDNDRFDMGLEPLEMSIFPGDYC